MNIITNIHKDLVNEINELNSLIITHLDVKAELVALMGKYLLESGGKRIRALLMILISKIFGYIGKDIIILATAAELIHAATLLHDDVVDDSTMRRSKPTANVIWGNKASILVGDFLFSKALQLIVETKSIKSIQSLSQAMVMISEGEVTQFMQLNHRRIITEIEYYQIIMAKTAELFGACCKVGAIAAGQPDEVCKTLQNFGRYLGNIFQIIDDLFDYLGNSNEIGKNIGDDFFEGKVTLPLIMLHNQLNSQERLQLEKMIKADSRSQDEFALVQDLIVKYQIKQQIINSVTETKQKASALLEQITIQNIYKNHLVALLEFSLNRSY